MKKRANKADFVFLKAFCRACAPVCRILFWIAVGLCAVLAIVCAIVPLVNVPTTDMLLPPFMKLNTADAVYEISLGNGILISSDAATVTLGNIKTAIYCGIAIAEAVLIVLLPVFSNLAFLLRNVSEDKLFVMKNAKCVRNIGLTILIGNTAVLFINRFFNYFLVKTFLSDTVSFRAGLDFMGIVMGLLVMLLGAIYAYTIRMGAGGMGNLPPMPPPPPQQHPGDLPAPRG